MDPTQFEVGTKVRINTNYLKVFLNLSEFSLHKDYVVTGIILERYFIEGIDFYKVLWDDKKIEAGFNKAFLEEIVDPNDLMKELCST